MVCIVGGISPTGWETALKFTDFPQMELGGDYFAGFGR